MMSGNERTMRSVITYGMGLLLVAAVPSARAQVNPSTVISGAKSAVADKGQAAQQTAKPAPKPAVAVPGKPAGKATAKSGRKKSGAKPAVKAVEKPATPGAAPAPGGPSESELKAARRDPFESLIGRQNKSTQVLPPGKPGLQVSTLKVDGIVRAPNGMIAVVSNPQARTYFLREGDHLYDGSVEKITMDGVSFHEEGKDAFGKPVERQVNKRIYSPSSGEQQ